MMRSNIYKKVLGLALAALTLAACSDKWDEHYDSTLPDVHEGSLWQAIKQNSNLSNFASVIEACGYDKSLASSQVFTVFAPTNDNFSATEAKELIQAYNNEKGKVNDEDNTVIKEFIQNHIALYNYSISTNQNDSIVMMNGKYAVLTNSEFGGCKLLSSNQLYGNGVLFTISNKADYLPNVFEYTRKDSELDSVASFLFSDRYYRKEFRPELSVAGDIVDGKTVYLDSVFRQQNDLFDYDFLSALLNSEDSTYWMIAPTNQVWKRLIEEYEPYYNYDDAVEDRDSLVYTNSRMAIMKGMVFSRSILTDAMLAGDSAVSTNGYSNYNLRNMAWGIPELHYFQYNWQPGAQSIFDGLEKEECSNGVVYKADTPVVNKNQTFFQWRIIEAENRGAIREVSKVENSTTKEPEETVVPTQRNVTSDNEYYGKVWGNSYVEFMPAKSTVNHSVIFNIPDVLSNIGYDIYLVTAPALANDSNATEMQRLPTKMRVTLDYHDQQGASKSEVLKSSIETTPDIVNYLLLAEDYKFPVCTYGLEETETQVSLTLETRVTSVDLRNNSYTRTMNIDCILLVPHGTMQFTEDGQIVITPHDDGFSFTLK